jgi:hypothetical protein
MSRPPPPPLPDHIGPVEFSEPGCLVVVRCPHDARAVERKAQEVDGFRALSAVFARVSLREPPKLDQPGLGRFQREAKPFQPIPQRVL